MKCRIANRSNASNVLYPDRKGDIMNLPWNYNMDDAPRNGLTKCLIAVKGSRKVRWCVWNRIGDNWSGMLPGEVPLCFVTAEHPASRVSVTPTPVIPGMVALPPGVMR